MSECSREIRRISADQNVSLKTARDVLEARLRFEAGRAEVIERKRGERHE